MVDLPRPKVDVTISTAKGDSSKHTVDVVISRDNKAISQQGEGHTDTDAVRNVIEKI